MTFANSALLWGLALASVPIIIYLLNRRRFKRITWAAMEFLLQAMKKNRRRLRIENLLLLIIRTLIVLFFVLAIARPLIETSGFLSGLARLKKNLVLVVDNSYSMGYKTGPTTALERAVKTARSFAEKLDSGDKISIVVMNDVPEAFYETPVTIGSKNDVKSVLADLNEISLSCKTTNVPKTIEKVVSILDKFEPNAAEGEANEQKTVYVFTDCQYTGWTEQGAISAKRFGEYAKAMTKRKAELRILDVGEEEAPNFAITDFRCDHALIGTEMPVSFEATLTNFSKRRFSDVIVSLMVDDLPQKSVTKHLEPGIPVKVPFTYQFKDRGYHHVQVNAKTDPLDADNAAYLAIQVKEHVSVLVVDGRPSTGAWESEADYLKAFFEAGRPDEEGHRISPFEADYWTHMKFENEIQSAQPLLRLRKYSTLILANVSDLSQDAATIVEQYVQSGGSVLIFLGDMVIPERYNLIMYKDGEGLLPIKLADIAGDKERMTPLALNIQTYDHPITKFFEAWQLALRRPMTFLYFENEVPAGSSDTIVIATYSDMKKTPAIVEKRLVNGGRIIVVTSSAWDEWNNWNKYQFFPILLGETLSYMGQSSQTDVNYMVGEIFNRLLTTEEWASDVYIVPPTGESIKKNLKKVSAEGGMEEADESTAQFMLTHEETDKAGIYRVVFSGEQNIRSIGERTENFAVNVDTAKESDLTKIVQAELQEAMAGLEPKPTIKHFGEVKRDISKDPDEAGGREFWKYFIMAVLILLALETILAQRFGKYEK